MSQQPSSVPQREQRLFEGGIVDTTLLFHELKRAFDKSRDFVPVDFRQLVSWIKVGDQLTHLVHPYPAKLLPHIAHFFLQSKGTGAIPYVLDPFCGSGTVALEASILGHVPLVADANPFALLLTKAKTTPYNVEILRDATRQIVERAARLRTAPVVPVINAEKWYSNNVKFRLEVLLRAIREYDDPEVIDFFLICFSATARKVSRIDPAISVPVQLKPKDAFSQQQNVRILEKLSSVENAKPIEEFFRLCHANIDRVESANKANPYRQAAVIVGSDARAITGVGMPNAGVPLIITSPPYGTAQKYVRASSLSLNWLGLADPSRLSYFEGQSIGREHSPAYRNETAVGELPAAFQSLIEEVGRKNSLRALITRQYLLEMRSALEEMYRTTASGGRIVLIVGNNEVCGNTLFTNKYISIVMEKLGCVFELGLVDQIKSRGLLTKRNATASVIAREYILVFKKL